MVRIIFLIQNIGSANGGDVHFAPAHRVLHTVKKSD